MAFKIIRFEKAHYSTGPLPAVFLQLTYQNYEPEYCFSSGSFVSLPAFVLSYYLVSCFDILLSPFCAPLWCRGRDSGFEEFCEKQSSYSLHSKLPLKALGHLQEILYIYIYISEDRKESSRVLSLQLSPPFRMSFRFQKSLCPGRSNIKADNIIIGGNINRRDNLPCSPLPLPLISETSLPVRNEGTTSTNPSRKTDFISRCMEHSANTRTAYNFHFPFRSSASVDSLVTMTLRPLRRRTVVPFETGDHAPRTFPSRSNIIHASVHKDA